MRTTLWTLVAIGMFSAWLAVPVNGDQPLPGQCDAGRCQDHPADGDCPEQRPAACVLDDDGRTDCTVVLTPCAPYLSNCQAEIAATGCWVGSLIPKAAPVPEVDRWDWYKLTLHGGSYHWFFGQNGAAQNVNMDFTMCVYAPGQPVGTDSVPFGEENVYLETSTTQTWFVLVKTSFGSCPALGGGSGGEADASPGPTLEPNSAAWWEGLFPGTAAAICDEVCTEISRRPNSYCLAWELVTG